MCVGEKIKPIMPAIEQVVISVLYLFLSETIDRHNYWVIRRDNFVLSKGVSQMQAHVFEGYFENGRFYNKERQIIKIPERYRVNIMLFDERVDKNEKSKHQEKRPFSDLFGEWSGRIWMSDDFDEPLEEMRDYM